MANTHHFWSIASNCPVVDGRIPNLLFGHIQETYNKWLLSSSTKCIAKPFWPLALVWQPFELLHHVRFRTMFSYVTHSSFPVNVCLRNSSILYHLNKKSQMEIRYTIFIGVASNIKLLWEFSLSCFMVHL